MSNYSWQARGRVPVTPPEEMKSETLLLRLTKKQLKHIQHLARYWCVSPQEALRRIIDKSEDTTTVAATAKQASHK